jgi:hypothetical protein
MDSDNFYNQDYYQVESAISGTGYKVEYMEYDYGRISLPGDAEESYRIR